MTVCSLAAYADGNEDVQADLLDLLELCLEHGVIVRSEEDTPSAMPSMHQQKRAAPSLLGLLLPPPNGVGLG